MEIGNLRRHDDESKENVKQAERLCSKRTILHVPHPFFTALRRERTRINVAVKRYAGTSRGRRRR